MSRVAIETIFVGNSLRNFTYLIEAEKGKYYCVDPFDADGVMEKLDELGGDLVGIINTHQHHDHICGNDALLEKWDLPLFAHHQANYDREFQGLRHGESIELMGENRIVLWDTPGHTMSHLSLLMEVTGSTWAVLCGDTMFNAGVGHCKLGGHPEVLYQTMNDYYGAIADEVEVFPGHEYFENNLKFSLHCEPDNKETMALLEKVSKVDWKKESFRVTMGEERKVNPFLRLDSVSLRKEIGKENAPEKEVFLTLRSMRNNW